MNESLPQERNFPLMRAPKAATVATQAEVENGSTMPKSFEALFLEHWNMVYRLLARMTGDPAEAEDLALETFLRLYQHPPGNGAGSNLRGWLYRVATNLGLRSIRSYQRRQRYEIAAGKGALEDPAEYRPAEILDNKEANRQARLALGRLPTRQAELLSLRYSGLAYKEIAQAMGLAPSSIGPLLVRAEREFAKVYHSLSREEE
jgi:RNA polymerase sigma-70 factor (ECF subfamily)